MADPFRPDQGANYALDGWVDGILAAVFIGCGVLGGLVGVARQDRACKAC
ncbi:MULTISPECIES: hypothetical protein [unclassified Brevundimonas]|nr:MULTISPECIES: hypothetical protein [unclassified Brevundimonas]